MHKAWGASPRKTSAKGFEPAKRANARRLSPASRAQRLFSYRSWGLRPRLHAVTCFAGLRRSEARAVFGRFDERLDHLRVHPVAEEIQLPEPERKAVRIRIALQVTEVLHLHKRGIEQAVVKRFPVSGVECQQTASTCRRSVHHLEQHAGSRLR